MATVRKRISELTALTSASLDTTIVGVDNGTTYKIELDTLADAVTLRVNILDRDRLSSLESATSSFETKGRTILSGSVSYTSLTNIPQGIVSQSTDLSSLNTFTASISTASLVNRLNTIESVSGSWITQTNWDNIANKPNDIVSSSTQISDLGFVTGSYTTINSFNSLTQSFNSISQSFNVISGSVVSIQGGFDTGSYQTFTTSVNTSISNLNTFTASVSTASLVTSISNLNTFTASQSTSSLVNRLNAIESVSGSWITESETGSFLTSLSGAISSSAQITAFGFVSGSYETTGRGIISSSANLVTTSSFNSYTASISTASLVTSISNLNSATSSYLTSLSGAISSSSQLTSSFDTRYVLSGSITQTTWDNIASKPSGIISGSSQLPTGLISGSSQLTSSYDTRYTLSGSVVSGTTPAGTISGSSQLTSSFDGRYTQTGSFNTLTASFNSFTASAQSVTTGSNSFNGTQTITGSLIITTGSFVASQILANTASLYLTSGSNMYVQNNGVVEITGSLRVSGSAAFNVNVLSVDGRSGDEGGEIQLAIPVTNTTLQNRVTVDIWQNRLRIFEGSAGANGVYIDLSKPTAGNNNEITYKASGIVNVGTFVTLDNVKVTATRAGAGGGYAGLSVGAVSTSFVANISATFSNAAVGGQTGTGITYTTTASNAVFGWGFLEGHTSTYILNDTTNSRVYRITLQIGASYNNNFISIERLH